MAGIGAKPPKFYILTPEEIPIGKKYKYGPNKTFRARFITDHTIAKKLFIENDWSESTVLDTPTRKTILDKGQLNLFREVGSGGFGSVFISVFNNNVVACKKIKLSNVQGLTSFLREKNALDLNHKNIVSTIATFRGNNFGLIVMEKSTSITLQHILCQGNLSDHLKLKYMEQVCDGIGYLHKNGILHLDIKPLNMLVHQATNVLKLCDFGNSVQQNGFGKFRALGTVRYSAPENFSSALPTTKSDVYSVGITMWQLLFNRIPYDGDKNDWELVYQIAKMDKRPTPVNHPFSGQIRGMRIYQETYKACWLSNADYRPEIKVIKENIMLSRSCLCHNGRWRETGLE